MSGPSRQSSLGTPLNGPDSRIIAAAWPAANLDPAQRLSNRDRL